MEQYIGNKQIMGVTIVEGKLTPGKNEIVKVMFTDGSFEIMPKSRLEMISTEELSDASGVQAKVKDYIGKIIYSVVLEHGLDVGEIDGVLDACAQFANDGLHKAQDILFKYPANKIPLLVINDILLENHAKQNNDGAASVGSATDTEN